MSPPMTQISSHLWTYFIVFVGAGVGGALRHGVNRVSSTLIGPNYPVGTLFVNILGGLLMGLMVGWFAFKGETASPALRLFLTTGLLGGFTTFSAFSLDAVQLWQRGQILAAGAYVAGSVGFAIGAVFVGAALARTALSAGP